MNYTNMENWETIKKRLTLLWDNEILDRPCVSVMCPKDKNNPFNYNRPWGKESLRDYYLNPQCMLERSLDCLEKTYFAGDAFPVIFPYWGTGGHAKYLLTRKQFDTNVLYHPHTIWLEPVIENYDTFDFNFDKYNPIFQAELQALKFLAQEGKGKFFVAPPDNCGSYDALAALRGNEDFIMDFIDDPENVKAAGNKLIDTLIESGNEIFDAIRENNDGGSVHGFFNTWSPGKHMQMQCDLSVMISPEMYEEFIVEELERTTSWLDHSIYHLDGMEQTRFLDMLLSIKRLNMIQWTQVDGQPDVTQNFHHIKRIQEAGKGVVIQASKHQLESILNHVSPKGLDLIIGDAADKEEADAIVSYVTKHSFCKTLF